MWKSRHNKVHVYATGCRHKMDGVIFTQSTNNQQFINWDLIEHVCMRVLMSWRTVNSFTILTVAHLGMVGLCSSELCHMSLQTASFTYVSSLDNNKQLLCYHISIRAVIINEKNTSVLRYCWLGDRKRIHPVKLCSNYPKGSLMRDWPNLQKL